MAKSITRLVSQIQKLQTQADRLAESREQVLAQVHTLIAELNRAVGEIKNGGNSGQARVEKNSSARMKRGGPRKGSKVAAKYRGPSGETWSGRGLTPVWLRSLVKQGKKAEGFLIKKSS